MSAERAPPHPQLCAQSVRPPVSSHRRRAGRRRVVSHRSLHDRRERLPISGHRSRRVRLPISRHRRGAGRLISCHGAERAAARSPTFDAERKPPISSHARGERAAGSLSIARWTTGGGAAGLQPSLAARPPGAPADLQPSARGRAARSRGRPWGVAGDFCAWRAGDDDRVRVSARERRPFMRPHDSARVSCAAVGRALRRAVRQPSRASPGPA